MSTIGTAWEVGAGIGLVQPTRTMQLINVTINHVCSCFIRIRFTRSVSNEVQRTPLLAVCEVSITEITSE